MPSKAELLSQLPKDEQLEILAGLDVQALAFDPEFWFREEQLEALHAVEWLIAYLAGRGSGKTRTGAEWVRKKAKIPGTRIALVARTVADVRDTMIEGESGILSVHPPGEAPEYVPTLRKVVWPNGSIAQTFTAEEPSQLRGPQFHAAWADELAAWRMKPDNSGLNAWDNLQIATRLGANPQIFMSTTPKRVPAIRKILDMVHTDPQRLKLIRGKTLDNAANLAAAYLETITGMYAGTSIAAQELEGLFIDKVDGALWDDSMIEHSLDLSEVLDKKLVTVIGVDPTVAASPGDECGIVVVKGTRERQPHKRKAWVVDDCSLRGSPDEWAKAVVEASKKYNGIVVAEKNQGHELVRNQIRQVDPDVPVVLVNSKKGKDLRAEPIVLCYEQGRVKHFTNFPELEDQMTSWVKGESGYSPDRMDALVHGLTAILVDSKPLGSVGNIKAKRRVLETRLAGVGQRG